MLWLHQYGAGALTIVAHERGASQLITRSTHHTVKSCDELTIVFGGVVMNWLYFS